MPIRGRYRYEYVVSQQLASADYPFYALIMAAMRRADSDNIEVLKDAWPDVWEELQARYRASGGLLEGETIPDEIRFS